MSPPHMIYVEKLKKLLHEVDESTFWDTAEYEPPPTLWHYTSVSALVGIVDSRQLRLGHLKYLNDSAEFRYGEDLLGEMSQADFAESTAEFEIFNQMRSAFYSNIAVRSTTFAMSFCKEAESLPHWQAYAGNGAGVAMGFKSDKLKNVSGFGLMPVLYGKEKFHTVVRALIRCISGISSEAQKELPPDELELFNVESSMLLDMVCAISKMIVFEHEKEFRFMGMFYSDIPKVNFIERGGVVKPHISYEFEDLDFLDEIKIGPVKDKELVRASIEYFLQVRGGDQIGVSLYETPFRF